MAALRLPLPSPPRPFAEGGSAAAPNGSGAAVTAARSRTERRALRVPSSTPPCRGSARRRRTCRVSKGRGAGRWEPRGFPPSPPSLLPVRSPLPLRSSFAVPPAPHLRCSGFAAPTETRQVLPRTFFLAAHPVTAPRRAELGSLLLCRRGGQPESPGSRVAQRCLPRELLCKRQAGSGSCRVLVATSAGLQLGALFETAELRVTSRMKQRRGRPHVMGHCCVPAARRKAPRSAATAGCSLERFR